LNKQKTDSGNDARSPSAGCASRDASGPRLDARGVLERVLYESLSRRVPDEMQWALG